MMKSPWWLSLAGLMLLMGVAVLGRWLRPGAENRCALDGGTLEPLYQIRIVDGQGASHLFCCVRCAELWLVRQPTAPAVIWATDEAGGGELEISKAYFVRSGIVTTPTTGNRIHVFKNRGDAEIHARENRGKLLQGEERPFKTIGKEVR